MSDPLILVSFCNVFPPGFALGVLDWGTRAFRWVDLTVPGRTINGVTGMAKSEDGYYILAQHEGGKNSLLALDQKLRLIGIWLLDQVEDGHSMVWHRGELYIVSTGTNRIIKVSFDGSRLCESVFWAYSHENTDAVHMNSLAFEGEIMYVSLFGCKDNGGGWMSANGGEIAWVKPAESNEPVTAVAGLFHPHSLCRWQDGFLFAESRRGRIYFLRAENGNRRTGPEELAVLRGYVRGLASYGDRVFVASSGLRRRSKSTGMKNTPPSDDPSLFDSYIYELSPSAGVVSQEKMTLYGVEIYDLLILEESPDSGVLKREDPILSRIWAGEDLAVDTLEVLNGLLEIGEADAALRLLQKLQERNPANGYWHYLTAYIVHRTGGDSAKALWHYEKALEYGFSEFWVRYHRGSLHLEKGRRELALPDLERAAELNPAHEGLRQALIRLREESR